MAKALSKINTCVEEGNYYEAHQMIVSVSQRFLKQKKIQEALDLLQNGVSIMVRAQQWTSALDLVERMLTCFGNEITDDFRGICHNINLLR